MLKLVNIKKDYVTKGVPTVHALKGLTINFRRNEFVAILGPSGCGKTTLLNIIGGLDRYTDGNLIIEGKSTKEYKDGDWDTYRNHSIGFVFQSYNLIAHQTILKNVELALTISGIKKEERKQRAIDALKTVCLEGMEKKRPNQLSGGQMQRVAIARALVNNPEILLADEPTGALDSETSVQIMDLLKEVAANRLVIMVTHNPDLANAYANRIVRMSDGLLTDDTNPYQGESKEELEKVLKQKQEIILAKGKKKQTSMSFVTATGLSFSNLLSKLKRTILIAVAGSIGIIGVSSVLSVSFGVRGYIDNMQDDMLSEYPIGISETAVDYTSLLTGLSDWDRKEIAKFDLNTEVGVNSMINYLMDKYQDFTSVKTNDINDELIAYIKGLPEDSVASISYDYGLDVTNNIFTEWERGDKDGPDYGTKYNMSLNGLTQMYISELKTVSGFSNYAQFVDLFTNFMEQLPGDKDYLLEQYDLIGENSRFPENANELVLVVDDDQTMTDFLFAQMGFFSEKEFLAVAKRAIRIHEAREKLNNGEITQQEFDDIKEFYETDPEYYYPPKYKIEDILGKKLTYYPQNSIWEYKERTIQNVRSTIKMYNNPGDPSQGTYDVKYNLTYNDGEEILEGTFSSPELYNGLSFDLQLERANGSISVPDKPYIGTWTLFPNQTYQIGENEVQADVLLDITSDGKTSIKARILGLGDIPVSDTESTYSVKEEQKNTYYYNANAQSTWTGGQEIKIVGVMKKKVSTNFGSLNRGAYYTADFAKMMRDGAKDANIIHDPAHPDKGIKDYIGSDDENDGDPYEVFVEYKYTSFRKGEGSTEKQFNINGVANALNTNSGLSNLFSLTASSAYDNDKTALRNLSGLATKMSLDETGLITTYSFEELPQTISIYPKNFDHKKKITNYLDKWNDEKEDLTVNVNGTEKVLKGEDRKELTYTDTIEMIVSVINTLITAITTALIVFTSLSLVVSCFMITVITYISTMERVKEIGVIRSLGGRKMDISRLFIAETLIIGLASGLIGIGITYIIQIILNIVVANFGVIGIANLPLYMAGIMVLLSIFLNVLSGLIPSMKASNQDPVVALRTE